MLETYNLRTEIARNASDFHPSMYEIFYHHFQDIPFFVYHTGITDRYSAVDYEDDEELDDEDLPGEGLNHLNDEVNSFKSFVKNSSLKDTKLVEYLFANHENNVFIATLILEKYNTGIMIRISPSRRRTMTAFTIFADRCDAEYLNELRNYAKQYIAPPPAKKDKIHIITQSNSDFYLRDITLTNKRSQFSFDNYNEGFEEISGRIVETLQKSNESGLVLFHGDPGTGKTSYLKHLLRVIDTKKLIYMPPDLTEHLSSPSFVTFMMGEATNSILLIEDAENVLRHREAGGSQAVSNILNLSDGILGDVLKLQVVCTFNSKLEEIDPALLRPGRCIAEYRFEMLEAERAARLMRKLHGDDIVFDKKPMSLAEVFNFKKPNDRTKQRKHGVGFTAQL